MKIIQSKDYEYLGVSGGRFLFKNLKWEEVLAVESCKYVHSKFVVIFCYYQELIPVFEYSYSTARRIRLQKIAPPIDLPFVVSMPDNEADYLRKSMG